MKSVTLVGDSVGIGYQPTVIEALAGAADVWVPGSNASTSVNLLLVLEDWVLSRDPDIVHLNCGLHDLKREFDSDRNNVPLDEYKENLRTAFTRIRDKCHTQVLLALTTPVNEEWHHARKPFDRFDADVQAFNQGARDAAAEFDIPVNDLHTVMMDAGRDGHLGEDGVHFTKEGYRILGEAVADFIRPYL